MEFIRLASGLKLSAIGYGPDSLSCMAKYKKDGTFINKVKNKIRKNLIEIPQYINAVSETVKMGCNLIDFSASYGDGSLIMEGVRKSGVPREKVVYTTRVSNRAQYGNYIEREFYGQLEGFKIDYMDILMFHWPVTDHFEETWMKMIELKEKGMCKSLGVANCNIHHLKRLYEISGVYPEINQVEIHPLFTQVELRKFCKENNIQIEAYSPTARQDDRLVNPPLLKELSKKYNKSITQIILRWHFQSEIIPIIRSMNVKHMGANLNIFDFVIEDVDMKKIDGININARIRYDPDNCDFTAL